LARKSITPKSENQRRYIEALKPYDIVFAIARRPCSDLPRGAMAVSGAVLGESPTASRRREERWALRARKKLILYDAARLYRRGLARSPAMPNKLEVSRASM